MKVMKTLFSIVFLIVGCLAVVAPLDVTPTIDFVFKISGALLIVVAIFTFYQTLTKK